MSDTDEEKIWVLQSRDGNPAAFESLIRMHQRMIHSLTFRMTGSMADAEDLAQETFIRAYRQLDSFQGTAKFSSWLYRIAVNTCLNWRRGKCAATKFTPSGPNQTRFLNPNPAPMGRTGRCKPP
jgi:RNA polymerase sigma-70 factor (ECF subfamily)